MNNNPKCKTLYSCMCFKCKRDQPSKLKEMFRQFRRLWVGYILNMSNQSVLLFETMQCDPSVIGIISL